MNFAFLLDPLESLNYKKDTSYVMMLAAQEAGHTCWYVRPDGLSLRGGLGFARAARLELRRDLENPVTVHETVLLQAKDAVQDNLTKTPVSAQPSTPLGPGIDAFFIRTDPPFDERYITATWLADHMPGSLVINSPHGLRTVNEKIWATRFTDFVPATLITRNKDDYLDFIRQHKNVIVKPTNGFGGSTVFKISDGDSNKAVAFEAVTNSGDWAIVQQYIPAASIGDKRILLLDGEILGAVLRVHPEGDHRNNFAAGGTSAKAEITSRDRQIVAALKPHLVELGLYFTGIDIIGEHLIEVNVTSPTCVQEMNQMEGKEHEHAIIAGVVEKIKNRAGAKSSSPSTWP